MGIWERENGEVMKKKTAKQKTRTAAGQQRKAKALAAAEVKPAPPHKPAAHKVLVVDAGVYMDRHRYTCIVPRACKRTVDSVAMTGSGIAVEHRGAEAFLFRYRVAMPDYPVRRAARIYLNSTLPKDPAALLALRSIVSS